MTDVLNVGLSGNCFPPIFNLRAKKLQGGKKQKQTNKKQDRQEFYYFFLVCVAFTCFPHVCVAFLQALLFPVAIQYVQQDLAWFK